MFIDFFTNVFYLELQSFLSHFALDILEHKFLEEEEASSLVAGNADSTDPESPEKNTWQKFFKSSTNQHHGYVESIEEAMVLLKKYELETMTKFSCYKSDKLFGSGG